MKLLIILIPTVLCAQPYTLGPDSQRRPDVPQGKVGVFPGTTRDYWVHVPARRQGHLPSEPVKLPRPQW